MKALNNLFKPTPKRIKKTIVSLKVFIGTISTAAYVSDRQSLAFSLLIAGALLDFILDAFSTKETE